MYQVEQWLQDGKGGGGNQAITTLAVTLNQREYIFVFHLVFTNIAECYLDYVRTVSLQAERKMMSLVKILVT